MLDIECVILAGGKSSRMGRDKALLPFGGERTLAQFQIKRLEAIFTRVYLSVKNKNMIDFEANLIEDLSSVYSSAHGLFSALKTLRRSIFVLSIDTPFVGVDVIERLFEASKNGSICAIASTHDKLHTLCGIYTVEALEPLSEMLSRNDYKIRHLIEKIPHIEVDFPSNEPFFNINHPEDYQEAQSRQNH